MLVCVVAFVALFSHDNAEFIEDVEVKRGFTCDFTYVGKREARPDVPHIAVDGKWIYFSMEPCNV